VYVTGGIVAFRDTDVEFYSGPGLSGFIKLHEGAVTFEPYDADREIPLAAGQMLTFDAEGRITGPTRIR
jgi:hypothetical protein